ncbi:AsmA-like C-terminal region-containing protein [Nitratireductor sp. GISD-1A_MAKvit]|uniref:AsmA-like C-terminal region-containing protein n=1 Tax=Nitratireductor sp. GISD-1A_MAKvit TaxID=3234198 RepID=UPI003466F6BC
MTLESVSVVDGEVTLGHAASGRVHTITDIDAELSAASLAGPWRFGGTLAFDEMPMRVSVSTGTAGDDGRMRLRVTAVPDALPLKLAVDGQARMADGAAYFDGNFALNTYSEEAMAKLRENADRPLALTGASATNRMSGSFMLRHDRLAVDAFRFETGPADAPYRAEGRANLALGSEPRFLIEADGAQLRFEPEDSEAGSMEGLDLAGRFEAFASLMRALPAPSIPGEVSISLPAIVAGDTTIRNIDLRAEPTDGGWSIGSVAATLPGRTRFEAKGTLRTSEALSFDGHMLLAIAQPSGFADWVSRDVDDAVRRLSSAGFSADVSLSRERQAFEALELVLGGARFYGRMERASATGARPALDLALEGEALDLDGMRAFASLFVNDAGVNRLSGHDVDLALKAGPVSASGLEAETVDTALRLRGGVLEIDRLALGGFAGAQLGATGQIRDFSTTPTGKVDATVVSTDLADLVLTLAGRFPENGFLSAAADRVRSNPGLLENAELDIVASAAGSGDENVGLAVSAQGEAGGTGFSLSLSDQSPRQSPLQGNFKLSMELHNDDAAVLYGLGGLPSLPLGLVGGATLELSAEGSLAERIETTVKLGGEGLDASFDGALLNVLSAPSLDGAVSVVSNDIEPWLAVGGVVLPGFGLGLPVELAAALEWSEKVVVMSALEGSVAGSDIRGDVNIALDRGRPRIDGALNMTRLDLAPAAELVLGPDVLSGEESGAWPEEPFSSNVDLPFSADLDLQADSLWAGFFAAGQEASLKLRLNEEGLSVSDLRTRVFDGALNGFATLRNNGGTGLLTAQIGLEAVSVETLLPQARLAGDLSARVSATASGKTVNGMASALTGSGSARIGELVISGLNPAALPKILEQADALGNEIDTARTEAFAPSLLRDGRFVAGDTEFAFTIAGGVARTPPIRLETDEATLTTTATADFQRMEIATDGTLTFKPGVDAVVGAEPRVEVSVSGPMGFAGSELSVGPLAQYLTQRALEREQVRVERMQSVLLEKQRLRREARYFAALVDERARALAEKQRLERELRQKKEEEEARKRAREEAEARAKAEARRAAKARAEEEARRAAEKRRREKRSTPSAGAERANSQAPVRQEAQEPAEAPNGVNSPDAVSEFFRSKNLSPERLRELLGNGDSVN